jgi:hypothetical protein
MAKNSNRDWNHPVQSNPDLGREKLRKDSSGLGYPKPVDISKKVDEAWTVHKEGFSSKLPKGK